mmetsp:Transcript_14769/g.45769  ORF Transcript_14769/g.45769 Transcript_14769/m.45769 type:complete len:620 (-) Transcript_14769:3713-5572(-)
MCLTLSRLGALYGVDYEHPSAGGDGVGPVYVNWDRDSVTSCFCDPGFSGPDCSRIMCAKADDPLTVNQNFRALRIGLSAADDSVLRGSVIFRFLGYTTSHAAMRVSETTCERAWEALENVEDVDCLSESLGGNGALYNVTFKKWPTEPMENNYFSHTGNPGISNFTCDVSGAFSTSGAPVLCNITDLVSDDVTEYEYCGRRGQCDFTSGTCYCIDGYEGSACTDISYVESASNSIPGIDLHASGADYIGDLVKLSADKSSSSDFAFMKITANDENLLSIRGDGLLSISQLDVATHGATISAGGLTVLADGLNIKDGGLHVLDSALSNPVLHVVGSSDQFTNTLVRVDSVRTEDANYWFARFNTAYNQADESYDVSVFSIRGDGYTKIEGELHVNNATSVHSLELKHGGFTINQGGLHVYRDGLVVYDGGADIRNNNLTVLRAHHNDATNAKDNGTVFVVESTAKFTSDINLIEAVMDVQTNNPKTVFRVNGLPKTYIDQGGLEVVGGVTIGSAGLNVSAGGIRVSAGGVQIKGGNLTVGSDIKVSGMIAVGANQVVSSQQASVSDIDATNDPGDGTFAALSTAADLATECERLRDLVDEIRTQMNDLLGKLRAHGLIAT